MMPILIFIKAVLIAAILRYFKIFNRQSVVLYLSGVLLNVALFYNSPGIENTSELIIRNSAVIYLLCIFLYSILKSGKLRRSPPLDKKTISRYLRFAISLFFISAIILSFSSGRTFSFVFSIIFFIILECTIARFRTRLGKITRYVNYTSGALLVFLYLAATGSYALLGSAAGFAAIYCMLLYLYQLALDAFTTPYSIQDLRKGMLPAETVFNMNGKYITDAHYMTIAGILRKKITSKMTGKVETISMFRPLTESQIKELKMQKDIRTLKIQTLVDIRPFLLAGILMTSLAIILGL